MKRISSGSGGFVVADLEELRRPTVFTQSQLRRFYLAAELRPLIFLLAV